MKKREKKKDPNQLEFSFESKLLSMYNEIISEDLEYAHVTDASPEVDQFEIGSEINEANGGNVITAYHGTPQKISTFVDDFVGGDSATDQEGPGIYFTTKIDESIKYASPNGYVYKVELRPRKVLSDEMGFDFDYLIPSITKLIKTSPNWKAMVRGYDDGIDEMVYQFIGMGQSEKEVFVNLYHEVFKENAKLFVRGMVKLGYDALYLPAKDEGGHIVVYNPKIIKVIDQKQV